MRSSQVSAKRNERVVKVRSRVTDATLTPTVMATLTEWDDRYYHVDQVLDRPGPRTDLDSFMAGDGVGDPISSSLLSYTRTLATGQELLAKPVQDPRHRSGWAWV